jgi:hypothetical protein
MKSPLNARMIGVEKTARRRPARADFPEQVR